MVRLKGHTVLLEAVALLRDRGVPVDLTIVGDGPLRHELEDTVRRLGIARMVKLVGFVGQDEISAYYDQADVFCLPSLREGLPVVLLEAMASALPVVASGIMGIPELVEHMRDGLLVPPARSDLLAEAVARLADDAAERRRLGEHGRQKVLSEHDLGRSAERLRAIFAEIQGANGADPELALRRGHRAGLHDGAGAAPGGQDPDLSVIFRSSSDRQGKYVKNVEGHMPSNSACGSGTPCPAVVGAPLASRKTP